MSLQQQQKTHPLTASIDADGLPTTNRGVSSSGIAPLDRICLSISHPLSADVAQELVTKAWREAFIPSFRSVPHPDNDPDLEGRMAGQRRHLHLMLALFAAAVAERAVGAGLYRTELDFFEAGDPATAGVARGEVVA